VGLKKKKSGPLGKKIRVYCLNNPYILSENVKKQTMDDEKLFFKDSLTL
jgi:hypothetical protein